MTIVAEPLEKQLQCATPEEGRQAFFDAKDSLGDVRKVVVTRDTLTLYGNGDLRVITLQGVGFKCSRVANEIILATGFGGAVLGPRQLTMVVGFPGDLVSVTAEKLPTQPRQPGTSCRSRVLRHGCISVKASKVTGAPVS